MLKAGAGGNWPLFDEMLDPYVVQQQSPLSCGAACGEMLLRDRGVEVTQKIIEKITGAPISVKVLAPVLETLDSSDSRGWAGGTIVIPGASDEDLVRTLNSTGSWAAVMWELGASVGHLVVVDGLDKMGRVMIRDPWHGTSYKMEMADFVASWSLLAVYSLP